MEITGDFLLNLGFNKERETLGWKWTNFSETFNRLRCRASMGDRKLSQESHTVGLV